MILALVMALGPTSGPTSATGPRGQVITVGVTSAGIRVKHANKK